MKSPQAKSLFDVFKEAFQKKAVEEPTPTPVEESSDLRYLNKFAFSAEFKEEFVKAAEAMEISRRDIYDAFQLMDKNLAIQKQSEYIDFLKELQKQ
jgi:hypothetical protein